ncbi:hypothetical protein EVAR_90322_1 [Eumeta japonica]|uniref:Uncharacterized protein n=1 Tax=Eumeta variegata TaxID=151549 RepID=A0A4C1ZQ29_EUMVA|nr:hypothetical protein EVAR_90322_1 [Eumeta japonica]
MALWKWRRVGFWCLARKCNEISSANNANCTSEVGRDMPFVHVVYRRQERVEPLGTPALISRNRSIEDSTELCPFRRSLRDTVLSKSERQDLDRDPGACTGRQYLWCRGIPVP